MRVEATTSKNKAVPYRVAAFIYLRDSYRAFFAKANTQGGL